MSGSMMILFSFLSYLTLKFKKKKNVVDAAKYDANFIA